MSAHYSTDLKIMRAIFFKRSLHPLNDALEAIGMPKAFSADEADFSKLGKSSRGNIYIGEVLHKTFISVDELGTKAGAVTKVEMREESYMETKIVKLESPFVYAIIDNATNLPVFIGAVMSLGKKGHAQDQCIENE